MKTLAIIFTVTLIAPSVFLIAPQRAQAIPVEVIADPGWIQNTITSIKSTLIAISTPINTAANVAQNINTFVLQPLAWVLSGNLMKLLTAATLDFIIGNTNGTGSPQFVQDLNGNLQRVGYIQANAFFIQFGKNSNSPFASSITSSLRTNYLQNTSSAGFFAANRNTMSRYSQNPNAFMAGNYSEGGVGAWFALTTQCQNNPYCFAQASKSHLASVVGGAQAARKAALDWGQGFLSWCGPLPESEQVEGLIQVGINPGDPCLDKNGKQGTIKTPGSTINATLNKVLGGTQDKLTQMGSLANEVSSILGDVGTIMSTAMFAADLLGGSDSDSGGLLGVGQISATRQTARLLQYQSSDYLGVTQSQVYQNAATLSVSGPDMLNRVAQYESLWNTLRGAANSASTTVEGLATLCTASANSLSGGTEFRNRSATQASAARVAIATHIAPVIAQADSASVAVASARAMVNKIQTELNSNSTGTGSAYATDLITLQTMRPTDADLSDALFDVESFQTAVAIPNRSLTVSGGTIMDRMSLISKNAERLKDVCTN